MGECIVNCAILTCLSVCIINGYVNLNVSQMAKLYKDDLFNFLIFYL